MGIHDKFLALSTVVLNSNLCVNASNPTRNGYLLMSYLNVTVIIVFGFTAFRCGTMSEPLNARRG